MRIRLIGTPTEVSDALAAMDELFEVADVSRPLVAREGPDLIRVYLTARPRADNEAQVTGEEP